MMAKTTIVYCKTYSATWGPKASFFKDCSMLFSQDEIKAGMIAPSQLIGRPAQLLFTTSRDESGAEKTVLAVVGALPKNETNAQAVKHLRECNTFQFDAGKGERPTLDVMNSLPKWLLEQIEQAGPVQTAPLAASSWTKPNPQPAPTALPTTAFFQGGEPQPQPEQKTAQVATPEPFDDALSDVTW